MITTLRSSAKSRVMDWQLCLPGVSDNFSQARNCQELLAAPRLFTQAREGHMSAGKSVVKFHGVLVTYRRPDALSDTLKTLAEQGGLDSLIVVDNAAEEAIQTLVEQRRHLFPSMTYIPSKDNGGPAGGVALGMKMLLPVIADGDWVTVLDDDDPPRHPTTLLDMKRLAAAFSADPKVGAVGLVGARFHGRKGRTVRLGDEELHGVVDVDYVGGGHFPCFKAKVLQNIGVYNAQMFFGFEELEYGLRLKGAGYRFVVDGTLMLRERAATGRLGRTVIRDIRSTSSPWRDYYSLRNRIYILKHHGHPMAALWVAASVGLVKPMLRRRDADAHLRRGLQRRAVVDGWCGRLGRTVEPNGQKTSR